MIKKWISDDKCTGCGACENICPQNAIVMISGKDGFLYPKITGKCIGCGLCENVCKNRLKIDKNNSTPHVYAVQAKSADIRQASTSGGFFSCLAEYVINKGGYVVAARYESVVEVRHDNTKRIEEIPLYRQSKYVQSYIGLQYRWIKKELQQNKDKMILFVGTPCQVAGLQAYLVSDYENLVTAEFICHGVNSPKALAAWIKGIEEHNNKKIKKIWFKYKEYGWNNSPLCTRLDFFDGSYVVINGEENTFMDAFIHYDLFTRKSCGKCDFKGVKRNADFTIADFWGAPKTYDDDKGTSLVMLNSKKSNQIFDKILSSITTYSVDWNENIKNHTVLNNTSHISFFSSWFLNSLERHSFNESYARIKKILVIENKLVDKLKRMKK